MQHDKDELVLVVERIRALMWSETEEDLGAAVHVQAWKRLE